ncbi:MAG: GNAT family N-acetyltransferase [Bacteroidetes bacterium]|nr:GNAT family N-acetyltransferase [Bacteroidota bacterium]
MSKKILHGIFIKRLEATDAVPYELLLDADPSMAAIEKYLDFSDIHIALFEGKTIGVFVLLTLNAATLEIKNIAVDERFQGYGIGTFLLASATQIAIDKGFKTIVIGTSNASVGQLYLYQKSGFEITSIKYNFFLDNYTEPIFENGIQCKHMIVLEKQLL